MFVIILAVLVCFGTVSCYRKKKVKDRQSRFHVDHPLEENDAAGGTTCGRERDDNDGIYYNIADSIYETVLDNGPPGVTLPPQPPPPPLPLPLIGSRVNPPAADEEDSASSSDDESEESSDTQSSTGVGLQVYPRLFATGTDITNAMYMDSASAAPTQQIPSPPTDPVLDDATDENETGSSYHHLIHGSQSKAPTDPVPYEAIDPYQHLTHGPPSRPTTYQPLSPQQTIDREQDSGLCQSSAENVGHDQPGPVLRAGYRLLGIRDRENVYELPPQQHQQPTGDNSTTQL
jgi:hypothetical protein